MSNEVELTEAYSAVIRAAQRVYDGKATAEERRILEKVRNTVETAKPRMCGSCAHWGELKAGEVLPVCTRIESQMRLEAETGRSSIAICPEGKLRTSGHFYCPLWSPVP